MTFNLFKSTLLFSGFLIADANFAAPRMTSFTPNQHGFKFENSFHNDFIPALDVRTGGLCGGMVWSSLDFYYNSKPIPNQTFRPANGTKLQQYLYARQTNSIMDNLDKWAEIGFNPGGARDTEFFNWGLQAGTGGRITELKSLIDAGKPAPLGLQSAYGETGNHQVLAIGYDMGRYRGDLGDYKEDFKIFLYDPNYPNEIMTLIADVADRTYTLKEISGSDRPRWRTYFVDKNYKSKVPVAISNPVYPADGTFRELLLRFYTGNDDLRGGNDNINVTVYPKVGEPQKYTNVNLGSRWISNYEETVQIKLKNPLKIDGIKGITVSTTFSGGIASDNWDMAKLRIRAIGGDYNRLLKQVGFKRFTGTDKSLYIDLSQPLDVPTGYVSTVEALIKTGGDDLRGGNDNLNIVVFFQDGTKATFANVNGSGKWDNNSESLEVLPLGRVVLPHEIKKVVLTTTFGGGLGGDNWDMKSIELRAIGPDVDTKIGSHGFKRFTGDSKTLTIMTAPAS